MCSAVGLQIFISIVRAEVAVSAHLSSLAQIRKVRSRRISSYHREGGNGDRIMLAPGETVCIADIQGAGVVKHIWCTINHPDPMYRRNLVLRAYWDDENKPSIDCPIGDFFGQGWSEEYNWVSLPLAASPKEGRGLNCYFPMPFRERAVFEIENQSDQPCRAFYYYVDYEEHENIPEESGYFHAWWSRSCNAPVQDVENEHALFMPFMSNLTDDYNHPIIDARGPGHYVGVNYYVESPSPIWYGEGDDMFFIDGEPWPPSFHGTGTEDYFNSSWCPKEEYLHPYFGYARVNNNLGWLGRTHCYRFHIEDPIVFEKSLRGSIERGHANCLTTDIITVAYWYQAQPHKKLARLPRKELRQNFPQITVRDVHTWREAWRQSWGGGKLWGNEGLAPKDAKKTKSACTKNAQKQSSSKTKKTAKEELQKQNKMLRRRKQGKKKKK